jgi:hypothetical protein
MKSRFLLFATVILFDALAIPNRLAAQEQQPNKQQPRYKLIDLGTLGGPSAYRSVNAPGYQIINDAGVVSFAADTAMLDLACRPRMSHKLKSVDGHASTRAGHPFKAGDQV